MRHVAASAQDIAAYVHSAIAAVHAVSVSVWAFTLSMQDNSDSARAIYITMQAVASNIRR